MNRVLHLLKPFSLTMAIVLFTCYATKAQNTPVGNVGIGTSTPDESAILDLNSHSQGFLLPRLTLTERSNIKNPATGLMVYQTNLLKGVYVFNGSKWNLVRGEQNLTKGAKLTTSNTGAWNLAGNAGTLADQNFIGTTDETALSFKVNNERSGIIDIKRGVTSLGYKAGYLSNAYNSVIVGAYAMQKPNNGGNNISIGYQSLFSSESGDHNVAIGSGVLAANLVSKQNTAVGSLAGYKSTGNNNVLLGFQSGYFETENNKLHINNDATRTPLIYGDFEKGQVGINTSTLGATFNINSDTPHTSGLRFQQLSSNSPAVKGYDKVLSVNEKGEVILVSSSSNTNSNFVLPIIPSLWRQSGNSITNVNTDLVNIAGSMNIESTLHSKSIKVGVDGLQLPHLGDASGKFLSLGSNGEVIIVDAPKSTDSNSSTNANTNSSEWTKSGDDMVNSNPGKVIINSGLRLGQLTSSSPTVNSNAKVLSVDADGNVILVNDQKSTQSTTSDGSWVVNGTTNMLEPQEGVDVAVGRNIHVNNTVFTDHVWTNGLGIGDKNLRFFGLNSESPTTESNGKVLSLDSEGRVILVPDVVGVNTVTEKAPVNNVETAWISNQGVMYPKSDDKVIIGHGIQDLPNGYKLYVKEGILAERVRVAVSGSEKWADYVFSDTYQLMPLNKLETFVKKHKHLPNIPSAEEISEKGLDLAEISAKQMEKIEELTLYIIKTQKQLQTALDKISILEEKLKK